MVIHPDHTVVLASRSRAVWRSLFERDLDLLLLDLIYASPKFGRWLLESTIGLPRADDASLSLEGAWHSVIGFDGRESDLEALWTFNGSRIRILIEDKIEAECQPGQAAAYAERAKRYVEDGEADRAATVLIAPLGYPERYSEDTAAFDYHVSIESIRDCVESGSPATQRLHRRTARSHAGSFAGRTVHSSWWRQWTDGGARRETPIPRALRIDPRGAP